MYVSIPQTAPHFSDARQIINHQQVDHSEGDLPLYADPDDLSDDENETTDEAIIPHVSEKKAPCLCGAVTIAEVRQLIREWVQSSEGASFIH